MNISTKQLLVGDLAGHRRPAAVARRASIHDCSSSRSPRASCWRTPIGSIATMDRLHALGDPDRDRRLRHRLLVIDLPQPTAGRPAQGRSLLRLRSRHGRVPHRHRADDRAVVPRSRPDGHGRGRRATITSSRCCATWASTTCRASSSRRPLVGRRHRRFPRPGVAPVADAMLAAGHERPRSSLNSSADRDPVELRRTLILPQPRGPACTAIPPGTLPTRAAPGEPVAEPAARLSPR